MRKLAARYALVYSKSDPAGSGVAKWLLKLVPWREHGGSDVLYSNRLDAYLAGFDADVVSFDFLDERFDVEAYVILSRHSSETGKPSLTVHHPGNPSGEARAGGRPLELAWAHPPLAKALLLELKRLAESYGLYGRFEVTLEATHHGPTSLSKPVVFVEIGSSPSEWVDEDARRVLAEAVVATLTAKLSDCKAVSGYGGGHYPVKHTRLQLGSDYCYAHILAKYAFSHGVPDRLVLLQSVEKSVKPVEALVIEKKGLKAVARRELERLASERGLRVIVV